MRAAGRVDPPEAETPKGVIGKGQDAAFWRKRLRQKVARVRELGAIKLGVVNHQKGGYTKNIPPLNAYFGGMLPEHIQGQHVQAYIDLGAEAGRAVRANREVACLSSCRSWLMRTGQTVLQVNPCMHASGTKKHGESKRERYETHDEYREVYAVAALQVLMLVELTYRTLQRPESDILGWTPSIIGRDPHSNARVLDFVQGKTGTRVKIALNEVLEVLIQRAMGAKPMLSQPLVHTRKGDRYTYSGITSMLTKAIRRANEQRAAKGVQQMRAFGFRDFKGKGATDMWRSGAAIERIQLLCGHADKGTTEKYIKLAQPCDLAGSCG